MVRRRSTVLSRNEVPAQRTNSNLSNRPWGPFREPNGPGSSQDQDQDQASLCCPSCLTLVWAVLYRASRSLRGLAMTPDALRLLQDLRRCLLDPPRQLRPRTVAATQDPRTTNAQNVGTAA